MPVAAIDFETFYDSKAKYSLRNLAPYNYVMDERFDAYLVSVHGDNVHFVGAPSAFDWRKLESYDIVAHNMAFDGLVLKRLIELGRVPDFTRREFCTADLAAYMLMPRNLAGAVQQLYGVKLSKAVRTDMDGKTLGDTVKLGTYNDLIAYADGDAVWCHRIWVDHRDKWPEWEREASRLNREACWRGVRIDRKATEAGLKTLESLKERTACSLPWMENDPDGKAGSTAKLSDYLRSVGVEPPASYKKDGPEMMQLMTDLKRGTQFLDHVQRTGELPEKMSQRAWDKLTEQEKFERGYGEYRDIENPEEVLDVLNKRLDLASLNPHIARLKTMLACADENDILHFSLRYHLAHTGRNASGSDSSTSSIFNPLNLPKEPVFGLNLRNLLLPREGHKFCIFDFGQIEARTILWLAGHKEMLDRISEASGNLYVAYGILIGKVKLDEVDTKEKLSKFKSGKLYAILKALALALGFGMGADKFRENTEKQSKGKLVFSEEEANTLVQEWRQANQPVCKFWRRLSDDFRRAALVGRRDFSIRMPSGRAKTYFDISMKTVPRKFKNKETGEEETKLVQSLFAALTKGEKDWNLWGGDLAQNITQATARDIMTQGAVEVCHKHPNWLWDWSVYDEVIFEVPDAEVEEALVDIPRILCEGEVASTWARGLPLTVDGGSFDRYLKM